jgi:hypothetical protein
VHIHAGIGEQGFGNRHGPAGLDAVGGQRLDPCVLHAGVGRHEQEQGAQRQARTTGVVDAAQPRHDGVGGAGAILIPGEIAGRKGAFVDDRAVTGRRNGARRGDGQREEQGQGKGTGAERIHLQASGRANVRHAGR